MDPSLKPPVGSELDGTLEGADSEFDSLKPPVGSSEFDSLKPPVGSEFAEEAK